MTSTTSQGQLALIPIGKKKVKTGCKTCKERRVKCDEAKPECHRCLSRNRYCGGYGIWGGGTINRNTVQNSFPSTSNDSETPRYTVRAGILSPLTDAPFADEDKKWYLDHFTARISGRLASVFDSPFWGHLVQRAAFTEPLVCSAAAALGAIYKSREDSQDLMTHPDRTNHHHRLFAFREYNKTLSLLRSRLLQNDSASRHVLLITCVLVTAFELVQGNHQAALHHVNHGLGVLFVYDQDQHSRISRPSERAKRHSDGENVIEPFFRTMLLSTLIGGTPISSFVSFLDAATSLRVTIPDKFDGPCEARRALDALLINALQVTEKYDCSATEPVSDDIHQKYCRLQRAEKAWISAYIHDKPTLISKSNFRTIHGVHLLQMYHSMISIMIAVAPCVSEAAYDEHTSTFASILSQTVSMWDRTGFSVHEPHQRHGCITGPRVTLELGIIPALYYTALKCRDPILRRQAAKLLMVAPYSEGIWHSVVVARAALAIIELEEDNYFNGINFSSNPLLETRNAETIGLPTLPVHFRFRHVSLVLSAESRTRGKLTYWKPHNSTGYTKMVLSFDFTDIKEL
ncbi:hypothetical protein HDV62DRAFT_257856 [Trichoderma sp. SZMC 28011]